MSTITHARAPPPQHTSWRTTFLASLRARDTREHALNAIIEPYTVLASRLSASSPQTLLLLQSQIAKTQRRCKDLEDEVKEKDRVVQAVQDEILVLQLERNIAVQKEEEAREENRQLVDRWMKEKERVAEEMNRGSGWK